MKHDTDNEMPLSIFPDRLTVLCADRDDYCRKDYILVGLEL